MHYSRYGQRFLSCILLLGMMAARAYSESVPAPQKEAADNESARSRYQKLRLADPEYARAMDLFDRNNYFEALPLLESLGTRYRTDPVAVMRLGICLVMTSAALPEEGARKQQRARARKLLVQAQDMGLRDELVTYYLSAIPEDGGADAVFSSRKEVNDAMREGELAYARKDYKGAIAAYTRAMEADPAQYHAVLYIGDAYFADGQNETAAEWFERATKVNPYLETAFRYWGDALMRLGKMEEARSRFIDAIIAEPYNRRSWAGISQWIGKNQVRAAMPDIKRPRRPEVSNGEGNKTTITIDPAGMGVASSKDGTGAWSQYQIVSGAWQARLFKERFPKETEYRHTLEEEVAALRATALSVQTDVDAGTLKESELDPGIAMLLKLQKAGVLESHILINLADKGIAQDYPAYRAAHRDRVHQYLDAFVVPKTAAR